MKRMIVVIILFMGISFTGGCSDVIYSDPSSAIQELNGPYLGMTPPGETPELFAPGIVADRYHEHSAAVFSPDGRELFWTFANSVNPGASRLATVHMKMEDNRWTEAAVVPFSLTGNNHVHSMSPNGKRLYFGRAGKVWVAEHSEAGWGNERLLNNVINGVYPESFLADLQEANSGNMYFVSKLHEGTRGWGIFMSRFEKGQHQPGEPLGPTINSDFDEETPYIDPEEDFILFASTREGGFGDQDIYVSFRQEDDSWGEAINLGARINTDAGERFPRVSPDGKYLFFVSRRTRYTDAGDFYTSELTLPELKEIAGSIENGFGNIYWVEAGVIAKLRPAMAEE